MWYCIVTNDPYFILHIAELHIGSSIRYENALYGNSCLNCYIVKIFLIFFNCFSEYIYISRGHMLKFQTMMYTYILVAEDYFTLANSADPDKMPQNVAFHLDLPCLPCLPNYPFTGFH